MGTVALRHIRRCVVRPEVREWVEHWLTAHSLNVERPRLRAVVRRRRLHGAAMRLAWARHAKARDRPAERGVSGAASQRCRLKTTFYRLLNAEADVLLAPANAKSSEEWQRFTQQYLALNDELHGQMNQGLGIEAIRWDRLGGGVQ